MWVTLCVTCVGASEGLRTVAYRDPIGIPTICYGETKGVNMGDKSTVAQCGEMLGVRVEEFGAGVDKCVTAYMPPKRKAAITSFSYNVGLTAFCKSNVARKLNAGDVQGGCDALLQWTRAGGVVLPGLVKRRQDERAMCLDTD